MIIINIKIYPNMLKYLVEQVENSETNDEINEIVTSWINETKIPNLTSIRKVSKSLNIPFGYFFLKNPPNENKIITEFRTFNNKKLDTFSSELRDTVIYMQQIQNWMSDYNRANFSLVYKQVLNREMSILEAANIIRDKLDLPYDWMFKNKDTGSAFKYIRQVCGNNNVLVMLNSTIEHHNNRKLDLGEFRAFILLDPYAPLIFINSRDTETGRLFSILHELVHLFLNENYLYNENEINIDDRNDEFFCNEVAAELLVPETLLKENFDLRNNNLDQEISRLARVFNCSKFVILNRLKNLKMILNSDFYNLLKIYKNIVTETNKTKGDGHPPYSVVKKFKYDSNFVNAINQSVLEGQTSITDALDLTKTNLKTFDELVNNKNV